ncbi:hypothetical protein D3C87_2146940 [compost metagenome]
MLACDRLARDGAVEARGLERRGDGAPGEGQAEGGDGEARDPHFKLLLRND